ncbi:MAG: hypothetical protein UW07_C0020G0012 [Candidatus Nomurabacteria bacterium GW2011_GWF2_43_8]|uniref:Permease n=1 Tax=Candidatus Nomurabacteria bacterium GW2011_GWF2_43_8 TaxID=1618779 RepID=A0A0G1HW98_9BACT|nr:MAG: hypothetical protein UW07_C0020G0012 [Candidatus Nomurabacteria bacterium GW2011_GWF2_43_8]
MYNKENKYEYFLPRKIVGRLADLFRFCPSARNAFRRGGQFFHLRHCKDFHSPLGHYFCRFHRPLLSATGKNQGHSLPQKQVQRQHSRFFARHHYTVLLMLSHPVIQAGVPLGVTFSFLVASPMINEVALVLLLGMFGWKIALIYVTSGLIISVFSGIIIGKMKAESLLEPFVYQNIANRNAELPKMTRRERFIYAKNYTLNILRKVWLYVLIGIGIGAWIHGYVPADFLAQYAGSDKWYAVPMAVLVGIPLYANATGIIPLVSALAEKGVAMGTTLAFMMSVTALSFPEFMILKRVMKVKLILIFAAIVGAGIIFMGYLFNAVI